jgi:hypothetical protein
MCQLCSPCIAAGVQDIPLQVPQQPHQRQQEHEYHPEEWEEQESSVQRCPDANIAVEEASEEENDSEYQKALQVQSSPFGAATSLAPMKVLVRGGC